MRPVRILAVAALPFCPSLTIVTAVHQQQGDYGSSKRGQEVDAQCTVLHYSGELTIFDRLESTQVWYRVYVADEDWSSNYMLYWVE